MTARWRSCRGWRATPWCRARWCSSCGSRRGTTKTWVRGPPAAPAAAPWGRCRCCRPSAPCLRGAWAGRGPGMCMAGRDWRAKEWRAAHRLPALVGLLAAAAAAAAAAAVAACCGTARVLPPTTVLPIHANPCRRVHGGGPGVAGVWWQGGHCRPAQRACAGAARAADHRAAASGRAGRGGAAHVRSVTQPCSTC